MMQPSAPPASSDLSEGRAVVRYALEGFSDDWIIRWEPVPESAWHDRCVELLRAVLDAWVASTGRNAAVFRDIAIQVRQKQPKLGWNPDVCVIEPAPPGADKLESLRLWDHAPPAFAFEAVSPNHPTKDYSIVPEKCAVAGVTELCVFDPLLAGPRAQGGPWLLQLWRRAGDGGFERVYAGAGTVRSEVLGGYLVPNETERRIRIARCSDGREPWLTREEEALLRGREASEREREASEREREASEREREASEREREASEREREASEREREALRRVAELEAELRRR